MGINHWVINNYTNDGQKFWDPAMIVDWCIFLYYSWLICDNHDRKREILNANLNTENNWIYRKPKLKVPKKERFTRLSCLSQSLSCIRCCCLFWDMYLYLDEVVLISLFSTYQCNQWLINDWKSISHRLLAIIDD